MLKIKKGDTVVVMSGKDKGKSGKVIRVLADANKAIVEQINLVKKHHRRRSEEQTGGIISMETPIHISKLMLHCKQCARGVKVGFTVLKDGTKARFCKRCQETI